MIEIRTSKKTDIPSLKSIWKICFGDDDEYIEFFFTNKYVDENTYVLTLDGICAAMLTVIPVKTETPAGMAFDSAMLYAIATHPKYKGRGYSTELMEYTAKSLSEKKIYSLILVPAEESLFNFYAKRGYKAIFSVRECFYHNEDINISWKSTYKCDLFSVDTNEYINLRNQQLQGKFFISYGPEEISYQKKLSLLSGGDLFKIVCGNSTGCATIERVNSKKIIIKELLISDDFINDVLVKIATVFPADLYVARFPFFKGVNTNGNIRPFGMIRYLGNVNETDIPEGYLGFAYD